MRKILFLISFTLVATTVSAADDYRIVTIQILKSTKNAVSFAGRSPAVYATLYVTETDGAQYTFRNDSTTAVATAIGIKEALEEFESLADYDVPVYNFYSFCTDSLHCNDTLDAGATGHDLFIIVKNVLIAPYQRIEKQYSDDYGHYFTVGTYAPYKATFVVYDAMSKTYSHQETLSDTLVWAKDTWDDNLARTQSELPSIEEAAPLAAAEIGRLYTRTLAPFWLSVQRFFFVPSAKDLRTAAEHAENGEWDEAMTIWEQYAGHNNRRVAAQSAFNVALACEVNGHYELALEWLQYAEKLYVIREIAGYRAILQRRMNESRILQEQLQDL
ncbi:MAG: DUF6340 family protein [Prevotellaceae bacterium]|jgi:hypothetical protein|nr:DUF6340 family protein [Prevotellaceae bacterium]